MTDPAVAARWPQLTVVSAMAHGEGQQGTAIALAVLPTILEMDDERARFYGDLVLNSLSEANIRALETSPMGADYLRALAKKYIAHGRSEGRTKARAAAASVAAVLDEPN